MLVSSFLFFITVQCWFWFIFYIQTISLVHRGSNLWSTWWSLKGCCHCMFQWQNIPKFLLHNWLVWQPIGNLVATNAQIALTCPRRVPTMYILSSKMSPNTLAWNGSGEGQPLTHQIWAIITVYFSETKFHQIPHMKWVWGTQLREKLGRFLLRQKWANG